MFIQKKQHEFATMLSVEVNLQCNGTIGIGIVFRQNASEKPVAKWGKLKDFSIENKFTVCKLTL
jgi:hypothetical protein